MNPQANHKRILLTILLAGLLLLPGPAAAIDTAACHCFRHREYDPKAPFAADDYILATSFNSLTAACFKISKKELVLYKMKGGIRQDDLLIALYLARAKKLDLDRLLKARAREKSWPAVIAAFPALAADRQDRLVAMLRNSRPETKCGAFVADHMIADYFGLSPARVEAERRRGLNEKELALVFYLARVRKLPVEKLIEQVKQEGRSWSEVAFYLGLSPKEVGRGILEGNK